MLVWKVIRANPGITRPQIWERVEHDIPAGYARRRFPASKEPASGAAGSLRTARSYLLTTTLSHMLQDGSVTAEGNGRGKGFKIARPLNSSRGSLDAVDESGDKAAQHLAEAKALLTMERALTRIKPQVKQSPLRLTREECEALILVVRGLRARGSGSGT